MKIRQGALPSTVPPRKPAKSQTRKAISARKRTPKKLAASAVGGRRNGTRDARSAGALFEDLLALQARLRGPGGCPWDREQTHRSLRTFLLEETHEVLDAMESGDPKKFSSELGDLLLQIVFHSLIASETAQFDIRDVIENIHSKMVRRHPHVFGDVKASTSKQVLKNWERLKAEEREQESGPKVASPESLLDNIPRSLPALMEANQLTRRAAKIGFDWEQLDDVLAKLAEEANELRAEASRSGASADAGEPDAAIEEEVGDLLFAAANVARFLGLDPEAALLRANRKFKQRFQWMERETLRQGAALANTERAKMEELWNQSKQLP